MKKYTTADFDTEFPNDDACLEWVKGHRWPKGIHCVKCDKITKHHKVTGRPCYECDYCGHQVYPTADTIFHKSATPLRIWFEVIYRMASTRCGVSAKQIQREMGVTYKTAWRMFHQIRTLLGEDIASLDGEVEVDETYIGGKSKGKRGRGAEGKSKVVGALQRSGKVVAKVVPDVKRRTLAPFMADKVSRDATLYTDEFPTYDAMKGLGYRHKRIDHSSEVYVNGDIHTNSIEGFWSLVKRGISGVYHSVSPQYLQLYLNEYAFRYNHRKAEAPMFKIFLSRIS
ncbi:IS1595 family transposase [Chloroflexota bacterium]